ncbi:MAG: hypothetical protein HY253_00315 [Burkholderiales bacterium]|nr:hypothetical protein [Burkholderiales bacterium]
MKTINLKSKFFLRLLCASALLSVVNVCAADERAAAIPAFKPRWTLDGQGVRWQVRDAHLDQLEMSGRQVSAVIEYGSDAQGALQLRRTVVWPMLRTVPDDTHASLLRQFDVSVSPQLRIDGKVVPAERLQTVRFDGQLALQSGLPEGLSLTRLLSPSPDEPVLIERWTLRNNSNKSISYQASALAHSETTPAQAGVFGSYVISAMSPARQGQLKPGESTLIDVQYRAQLQNEMVYLDVQEQLDKRRAQLQDWSSKLVLETPDAEINRMFQFAKIRATESIFATRGGLLHGPGGTRYYAAIWANDQAEYANPFFPYIGDAAGIESAINSFRLFGNYMNDAYQPIPSSIVAEGRSFWNGAGDRGDCAMIAYGASHFALAQGDAQVEQQLRPLIDWCLEFTRRKRDATGIIASDSDELENRFPAGKANLSTNVLAYAGLLGAARLSDDASTRQSLMQEAEAQRTAITRYFSASLGGFETYRYYEGNTKLRAWIALPLVFGMEERRKGTVDALLSPALWSANGLLSEAGSTTYWDRSTLYAFRGLMKVGELERVFPYFQYYSRLRLTGEHVPYAIEAWPEGNQRHLSAESALYARVVTEGLFGIEPLGLRSFNIAPRLPAAWPKMALKNVRAFGANGANRNGAENAQSGIDIATQRHGKQQQVRVFLHGKIVLNQTWDGVKPIMVKLPQ